ncbi:Polygalacturonase 1 beta-like protein 3 [Glycine soja]
MCDVEYWVCKRFHDKLGFGGGVGGALLWSEVGVEYSMQEKSASECYSRGSADHDESFTGNGEDTNVADESFHTGYGSSEFKNYSNNSNVLEMQFSTYSNSTDARTQSFSSYSKDDNFDGQSFQSYSNNFSGAMNKLQRCHVSFQELRQGRCEPQR